jgi:nucleolar MIF4G domain-containing protein 1
MWDFLRELGETSVGGIELLRRQEGETRVGDKMVGRRKMGNLAKAYAWWIAKDCCTLAILKVLLQLSHIALFPTEKVQM